MVFTTNKPMEERGCVLHDADLAEAILDRVLERGRVLHFKGPSFRTRHLRAKEWARVSGTHRRGGYPPCCDGRHGEAVRPSGVHEEMVATTQLRAGGRSAGSGERLRGKPPAPDITGKERRVARHITTELRRKPKGFPDKLLHSRTLA